MPFLERPTILPGDVLATHTPSCVGWAIQLCTGQTLDHLAMAAWDFGNERLVVYEADFRSKAYRKVTLAGWLKIQRKAGCKVYRIPLVGPLTDDESAQLYARCESWLGRPYDFTGAARSRRWGLRWMTRYVFNPRENDGTLFCNEAVGILDRDVLHRLFPEELPNASAHNPGSYVWQVAVPQGARLEPVLVEAA